MGRTIEIQVVGHPALGGTFDPASTPSIDIGRSGACTIVLDDPLIAPKHCRIVPENDRVILRNLDPEIGVICDGADVERETTLVGEHDLDLGGVQLVVRVLDDEAAPTDEQTAPSEGPATPAPSDPDSPPSPSTPATITTETPPGGHDTPENRQPPPVPPVPPASSTSPAAPPTEPAPEPAAEPVPGVAPGSEPEPGPAAGSRPAPTASLPPPLADLCGPLLDEFGPDVPGLNDPSALEHFAVRAHVSADQYGFDTPEDLRALLRCMILIGDDLTETNRKNADIEATLSLTGRPAEQRLRRATKIAERIAAEQGGPAGPAVPTGPVGTDHPGPHEAHPKKPDHPPAATTVPPSPAPRPGTTPEPPAEPSSEPIPEPPAAPARIEPASPTTSPAAAAAAAPAPAPAADPVANDAGFPGMTGYEIESINDDGVFGGRDTTTNRRVLVALCDADRAQAAATLTHRNLAKIIDAGRVVIDGAERGFLVINDDDTRGSVADLLERVTLKPMTTLGGDDVLGTLGLDAATLPPRIAEIAAEGRHVYERIVLHWIADLAEAVQLAHDAGLPHGGIGPSCTHLDRHGLLVLRWLGRFDPASTSAECLGPGVIETLAPERVAAIASGNPPARPGAADLWSLGLLGYTLLAGRSPFSSRDPMADIVTLTITPLHELDESIGEPGSSAIMSALRRDPGERPASAQSLAESLRRAASDTGEDNGKKRFGLFGKKG